MKTSTLIKHLAENIKQVGDGQVRIYFMHNDGEHSYGTIEKIANLSNPHASIIWAKENKRKQND